MEIRRESPPDAQLLGILESVLSDHKVELYIAKEVKHSLKTLQKNLNLKDWKANHEPNSTKKYG